MKQLFVTAALLMTTLCSWALPVKKGVWKTLPLEGGTEVSAHLVGDEHCHYWLGVDGNRYVASDGKYVLMPEKAVSEGKARFQQNQKRRMTRLRKATQSQKGYYGQKKGLIILAQFSDQTFHDKDPQALYNKVANQPGYSDSNGFVGSVYDYFMEQSYGQFQLTFDVLGPVTVSGNMATYGANDYYGEDKAPGTFVAEVINKVKSQVTDWQQYDWDDDGEIDQVMIIYAGYGEADGGGDETIFPHEWALSASDYGRTLSVATGLYVNTYAVANERAYTGGYGFRYDGLGGICHEFSHCLGLPDMYCTDYSGYSGMGEWDQMADGSYNGRGFVPAGFTSHEKMLAGWLQPTELTSQTNITAMKPLAEADEAYIIYNKAYPNEYYLLENRQLTGFDSKLPAQGLLILHVDYDADIWAYNFVNTNNSDLRYGPLNDHQRCILFRADGKDYYQKYSDLMDQTDDEDEYYALSDSLYADMATDIYPQPGSNQLTNTSLPRAFTYNQNTDGRKLMNISITDITQNADGTISFSFAPDGTGSGEEGDNTDTGKSAGPAAADALFYESFDLCGGTGGNDGGWSGNVASAVFQPDNDGWVAEKAYGADQCAKFGTGKVTGTATTPAFQLDGQTTLTFRAAAWNANNDGTTLTLSATGGATLEPSTITLTKGEWTDYEVTLTAQGSTAITFTASKGRFFLDEVVVANPDKDDEDPDTPAEDPLGKIDIDGDGKFTISDITRLINLYLESSN
ncbi:MAG: M6 family metalloprotease domain-containing protein [Bacteroidaceae bacterium]|nr:M6 family metalloprotease domain-containing protein [Bacteroidaceae bacterium]